MFVSSKSTTNNYELVNAPKEEKKSSKTERVATESLNSSNTAAAQDDLENDFVLVDGIDAQEITYPDSRIKAVSKKVVSVVGNHVYAASKKAVDYLETADQYAPVIQFIAPETKPFFLATKTFLSARIIERDAPRRSITEEVERNCSYTSKALKCVEGIFASAESMYPASTSRLSYVKKFIGTALHYTEKAENALKLYHQCVQSQKS